MGLIFVAGVHGVGKTACCLKSSAETSVPHYSASEIIKREKISAIQGASKMVQDVPANQELLIQGIEKLNHQGCSRFLLDGHLTIINAKREIEKIPVEVFARLNLEAIVVYYDDPLQICSRLKERDGIEFQVDDVSLHQAAELAYAQVVALDLKIPLHPLQAFDSLSLSHLIQTIWLAE